MTSTYLLRHGKSTVNGTDVINGRNSHAELDRPVGRDQAVLAGRWLLRHNIFPDAIIASPATRTLHTTVLVMDELGMSGQTFQIDSRLQEISQGVAEGRLRSEMWTPEMIAARDRDPYNFAFPGGETVGEVVQRMLGWLHDIESRHPAGTVLVGAHGLATRALISHIIGRRVADHETPNCSLTLIESIGDERRVPYIGRDIVAEQLAFEQQKV